MNCPACSTPLRDGRRRCEVCDWTLTPPPSEEPTRDWVPALPQEHASTQGRFRPGDTLAGRYRIVECVGKGGMGEVYRADDLTLDQPVALKFLPEELSRDEERLRRLRREVKIARQISHPHVCRVHDIGVAGGLTFLSMEYIHGEDLRSLLRRIGRIPAEKAVEIAAELASGLAAAHECGILHRDLKPANVMIDERGRARITDFGLAAAAGSVESQDVRSGTPAYMAPEQWAGTEVTERSDLYSLGLVLYELFTGQLPFGPQGPQGLPREAVPPRPSKLVPGLASGVEGVILRCLERDPRRRPASALAVRAVLPGGDPLAAAVARGETPARALVADAWEAKALRPATAWACLVLVLAALPAHLWMAGQARLSQIIPLPKSPEILRAEARAILARLGYPGPQLDRTQGFAHDGSYLDHLLAGPDRDAWPWRLSRGEPSVVRFWYRESPRLLVPHRTTEFFAFPNDPPDDAPGAVLLELDTRGHLRRLEAVPPDFDDATEPGPAPDWKPLFQAAGLDLGAFASTAPRWFPPSYADRREAWEGAYPEAPEVRIRLEAAAFRGRIVAFRVIEPWTESADKGAVSHWVRPEEIAPRPWARLTHLGFHALFVVGLALLARRNLRLGRGDAKLALRLATFVFALVMAQWAFGAHHVPGRAEVDVVFGGLYRGAFAFALTWLFYVAMEPYVRRLWPRSLISWVRLLDGRLRDPVVGRDLLLGCAFGIGGGLMFQAAFWAPLGPGLPPPRPDAPLHPAELIALRGVSEAIAQIFAVQVNLLNHILLLIGGLLLLRFVLRRTWLAVAVHGTLYVFVYASAFPRGYLTLSVWIGLWYLFLFRFGWTSLLVGTVLVQLLTGFPLTTDLRTWYAHATLLVAGSCLALTLYAFKVSLGGRPLFQDLLGAD